MTEGNNVRLNVLPSPTYNWLKMNDAYVQVPAVLTEGEVTLTGGEGYTLSGADYQEIKDIAGGMGYEFDLLMQKTAQNVRKIHVPAGQKLTEAVRSAFLYQGQVHRADVLYLDVEEGAELTLCLDFQADKGAEGFAAVQTKVRLGKGALVKLVQVQRLNADIRFLNDVAAKTEENARFEQIQITLSGAESYWGSRTDLVGKRSFLKTDIAYLLQESEKLDMNYIANHIGRKTECDIHADGVLRDTARKLFRGTIDLRKGAKGAVGNELETVLLMDDDVVNQTIPVILCDEEDVEGNHGATIGRIDENTKFYLESRGMSESAVYEMMAQAKVDAVIHKIPDAATKEALLSDLGRLDRED